jgi:iron complex outermembrane receptor protein
LGVVFEPTREFSMGVDFWWINQKDLLAFPNGDNIIQDCIDTFNAATLNCTGTLAQSERFRTANIPGFGAVKVMNTAFNQIQNYADQNTNGIDIEARLRLPPSSWGSWTFAYNGTYILDQQQKITYVPNQDWVKTVGGFSVFGPVVQYKHLLSATWAMSAWTVTLNNNYQHSYDDQDPDLDGSVRVVHAWSTFDLYARWTGVKNLAVVAGVNNLFNRQPPSSNQNQYFQVGYDPTYVNPRLRTPYINLTYKFF